MRATPLCDEQSFDPETLCAMGTAFEMACRSLGLSDASDPMSNLIAAKIIERASAGEHDAVRLHEAVMRWAASAA